MDRANLLPDVRPGELQSSALVTAALGTGSGPRRARLIVALARRHEGGQLLSQGLRRLLARDFEVTVGSYSYGPPLVPGAMPQGTSVGRYVSVGPGLRYYNGNHPMDRLSLHPYWYNPELGVVHELAISRLALRIEHEAWIGGSTTITPGCSRIGVGAVVGAGSVVTKDVPDFAVVAGAPARILRYRFPPHIAAAVLATAWWEHSICELRTLADDFARTATPSAVTAVAQALGLHVSEGGR